MILIKNYVEARFHSRAYELSIHGHLNESTILGMILPVEQSLNPIRTWCTDCTPFCTTWLASWYYSVKDTMLSSITENFSPPKLWKHYQGRSSLVCLKYISLSPAPKECDVFINMVLVYTYGGNHNQWQ